MKQAFLIILILLTLSCEKEKVEVDECPRRDIELKIVNRTSVIVGIQSVLFGCAAEANWGSTEYIDGFSVEANQTSVEVISAFRPSGHCFNAFSDGERLHPFGCIGYGSPITEETKQIIILITFNGTDYLCEYL